MTFTSTDIDRAADIIRSRTTQQPKIGLVLGSGLGALADELDDRTVIPVADIPGWPVSTVHGHSGNLVIGTLEGQMVIAQQGRVHFYEGYTMQQVTFPVRVMRALGVDTLLLTNAAGGMNTSYRIGDLMMFSDHINLLGMGGQNPLIGPNDDTLGPRFPGMAQTYDTGLRRIARQVADAEGLPLREGVYVALPGPNFETPAEIRMLRLIGADAVGMSTAPEVIVARHGGMRVFACSGVTNVAIDQTDTDKDANHEEVLDAGKVLVPRLRALIRGMLRSLPA